MVGLRQLVALVNVGVGLGVVTVGGDGVVVVVECEGGCRRRRWWESLQKDQASELSLKEREKWNVKNETENDHFREREGRVPFFKNDHFQLILDLIFKFIFEKWKKNEN